MKLVFDLGGVVLRWRPDEFLVRWLPERAPDAAAALALAAAVFEGFGGDWAEFDRGRLEAAVLARRIAARTGLPLETARHLIDAIPGELQPMDDTVALLERLRRAGQTLCFLSNMPAPYADHLQATHAVLGAFEAGLYSSRIGLIKPEPALFEHAASVFGAASAELLLIDDNPANVVAAREAGWQGLRFESASQCEADLRRLGFLPD